MKGQRRFLKVNSQVLLVWLFHQISCLWGKGRMGVSENNAVAFWADTYAGNHEKQTVFSVWDVWYQKVFLGMILEYKYKNLTVALKTLRGLQEGRGSHFSTPKNYTTWTGLDNLWCEIGGVPNKSFGQEGPFLLESPWWIESGLTLQRRIIPVSDVCRNAENPYIGLGSTFPPATRWGGARPAYANHRLLLDLEDPHWLEGQFLWAKRHWGYQTIYGHFLESPSQQSMWLPTLRAAPGRLKSPIWLEAGWLLLLGKRIF